MTIKELERIIYRIDYHISMAEGLLDRAVTNIDIDFWNFIVIRQKSLSVLMNTHRLVVKLEDLHKCICELKRGS